MLYLTKLTLAATTLMLAAATSTYAQDEAPVMRLDVKTVDVFTSADVDADDALDRDEFVSFVVMQSDAGYADYSAIKLSGAYDDHFNMKDSNADGLLTAEELSPSVSVDVPETEEPETVEAQEGLMEKTDEAG